MSDVRQITRRQHELEKEAENADDWRTLTSIVDRLLFWVSLIIMLVVGVWMIIVSTWDPELDEHATVAVY